MRMLAPLALRSKLMVALNGRRQKAPRNRFRHIMHIKAQQLRTQLRTTELSEDKTAIVYTVVVALLAVLLIVVLAWCGYFANRLTSPDGFSCLPSRSFYLPFTSEYRSHYVQICATHTNIARLPEITDNSI
jgi:hypothetical protein